PAKLWNAATPAPIAVTYQAYQQKQTLGLNGPFMGYFVGGGLGLNEKWMTSSSGSVYGLLPNGNLVKWFGNAAGTNAAPIVATLDTSFYADPSKLWNVSLAQVPESYLDI